MTNDDSDKMEDKKKAPVRGARAYKRTNNAHVRLYDDGNTNGHQWTRERSGPTEDLVSIVFPPLLLLSWAFMCKKQIGCIINSMDNSPHAEGFPTVGEEHELDMTEWITYGEKNCTIQRKSNLEAVSCGLHSLTNNTVSGQSKYKQSNIGACMVVGKQN